VRYFEMPPSNPDNSGFGIVRATSRTRAARFAALSRPGYGLRRARRARRPRVPRETDRDSDRELVPYVAPLYLKAEGMSFPQLKRVIAAAGDRP